MSTSSTKTSISSLLCSLKYLLVKYQDGSGFIYSGQAQTWINEVSVGSVVEATLHTVPATAPLEKTASEITALLG